MNGGNKAALVLSCLTIGGCAATAHEVKVRAVDPAAAISQGGDEIAVARGQLALGNVGLALEALRKAQRERPSDPAPLAGIAECYVSMGRFDLAQQNYEAALALAPHEPKLLLGLAAVFESEGQLAQAADARAEAANVRQSAGNAARGTAPVLAAAEQPAVEVTPAPSITVQLPPARSADTSTDAIAAAIPPQLPVATAVEQSAVSSTATVEIPPVEAPAPAPIPQRPQQDLAVAAAPPPRLERLSSGEVALVTTAGPLWQPQRVAKVSAPVPVRWVALTPPASGRVNLQVLNAARSQGLASSARGILLSRGWRKIAIGNAAAVQQTSVVYYPKSHAALGRRLAAQFGVSAKMVERDDVVLILGRDSLDRIAAQRRS